MSKVFNQFISEYKAEKDLEKRVLLTWEFTEIYFDTFRKELEDLLLSELEICKASGFYNGEAVMHVLLSQVSFDNQKVEEAKRHIEEVTKNYYKISEPIYRGYVCMFMSIMSVYLGNYAQALDQAILSKREFKGLEHLKQYGWCHYTLGAVYLDLKDVDAAILNFRQGLEHFNKFEYPYGIARCETGIASAKIMQNELDEAEVLFQRSLKAYESIEMHAGSSRVYNDLGIIHRKKDQLDVSVKFLKHALDIRRNIHHIQGVATSLNELGESLILSGKPQEALIYLQECVKVCTTIGNKFKLYRTHHLLYQSYKLLNQPELALQHFENYNRVKETVSNDAVNNKIKDLEKKLASEKAEMETEIQRIRNVELKAAFDQIEVKNREILDSINYASRIQNTLLASKETLNKNLPEHFVLFQPKDIVSGDFYWFAHGSNNKDFFLAVCDSTGHGVPGAFMSLLNINFLNEAITERQLKQPGEILNHVRQKLMSSLSQDEGKDGMDCTFLKFESGLQKPKLSYAAAFNYPILIRSGQIIELPFDKMPVGKSDNQVGFRTFELEVEAKDMLYLSTDGYADQFGGFDIEHRKTGGKKMKKSNLKKLLTQCADFETARQKDYLLKAFNEWKGDLEQVDDLCIIGIRIP